MIEKLPYESGFMLSCDTCSHYEEFEVGNNWDELMAESKGKGWRFKQNKNNKWEHYCPVCVEEYNEKYRKEVLGITKEGNK